MQIIGNINALFGEELKSSLTTNSKLKAAASCFSMYAFVALKKELSKIDMLEFIFISPTFVPEKLPIKLNNDIVNSISTKYIENAVYSVQNLKFT
jgi:hypothetical protein